MHSLLEFLFILSALFVTAYSLQCKHCTGTASCTGSDTIACPPGTLCGYKHIKAVEVGKPTETFIKSCMIEKHCNMNGTMTYPQITLQMVTSCCSTDNCEAPSQPLPTIGTDKNGLVCRACTTVTTDWCYTSETMQCTGDQNMCLLQSTKISAPLSIKGALRGCATKSICDLGSSTTSEGDLTTEVKIVCTSGINGLHYGIILPAFFSVVMLKVLS